MPIIGVTASSVNIGGGYWITQIQGSNANDIFKSIFIDSSKNLYQVYQRYTGTYGTGSYNVQLIKLNPAGVFQWSKNYAFTSNSTEALAGGGADATGNLFWGGLENNPSLLGQYQFKLDSSGNQLLQKRWNNSNGTNYVGRAISVSPNGSYVGMYSTGNGSFDPLCGLFDTSGNLSWQNETNISGQNYNLVVLNDGTILETTGSYPQALLTGNTSYQWAITGGSDGTGAACTNSAGELYCLNNSAASAQIIRVSPSNGSAIWGARLTGMNSVNGVSGVAANSTYNYSLNWVTTSSTSRLLVQKRLNSNGNLVWQRELSNGSGAVGVSDPYYTNGQCIAVDATDANIWISCYFSGVGTYQQYVFKLPADGSKTGTYTNTYNWTWATSSYTNATFTPTRTTTTISPTTGGLTLGNGTLSISAANPSTVKVQIPQEII